MGFARPFSTPEKLKSPWGGSHRQVIVRGERLHPITKSEMSIEEPLDKDKIILYLILFTIFLCNKQSFYIDGCTTTLRKTDPFSTLSVTLATKLEEGYEALASVCPCDL